jgi:ribosome biogenesis GTPase
MREFAPWVGDDGLSATFADIEILATNCRFADCGHDSEPGCAVLIAAASDDAIGRRLESWRRLQRELAWLARRNDARLMTEERRRWATSPRGCAIDRRGTT